MPLLLASSVALLKTSIDTDGEVESIHDSHLCLESERTCKITVVVAFSPVNISVLSELVLTKLINFGLHIYYGVLEQSSSLIIIFELLLLKLIFNLSLFLEILQIVTYLLVSFICLRLFSCICLCFSCCSRIRFTVSSIVFYQT